MRTRRSHKNQQRLYNGIKRDLIHRAQSDYAAMRDALRLCLAEIEQFHATAYPKCDGGCPAHEAMAAAKKALGLKD